MKATVLKAYRDRETGAVHSAGEKVVLTVERAKELAAAGFVEPAPKPKAAPERENGEAR